MEQRVSIITLGVTDLKRSREFYERLGWRRSMAKTEGVAFFQAGGIALALYPRHELAKDANISPNGYGFNGVSLAYNTRDRTEVDSVLKEAAAAGAIIRQVCAGSFLGRLFRILFRPGWFFVGGRLESVLPNRRRWEHSNSGLAARFRHSAIVAVYATFPAANAASSATTFPGPCTSEVASACSARLITSVTISTGS